MELVPGEYFNTVCNRNAAGILYRRHANALRAYAATLVGPSGADDIVQEVFLALMARPGRFKPAKGRAEARLLGFARSVARVHEAIALDVESLEALADTELEDGSHRNPHRPAPRSSKPSEGVSARYA